MSGQIERQAVERAIANKELVKRQLDVLNVKFTGSTTLEISFGGIKQTDEAGVAKIAASVFANRLDLVRGPAAQPMRYWEGLIDEVLEEYKAEAVNKLAANLAHSKLDGSQTGSQLAEFAKLISANPQPSDYAVFYHFMWQVKRKLLGKEVTYHMMPIIWGKQESGKSTAIKRLLSPLAGYVTEGITFDKLGDDRYFKQLQQHFVGLFEEMQRIQSANLEVLKAAITGETRTGRPLYTDKSAKFKQNCTFIGTSNDGPSDLIRDTTGLRRFYYIHAPDLLNQAAINSLDYVQMWREVDEMADQPTLLLEQHTAIKANQEQARTKTALELFIEEGYLTPGPIGASTFESADAYAKFSQYCEEVGMEKWSKQTFNSRLSEKHGFIRATTLNHGTQRVAKFPTFFGTFNRDASPRTRSHKIAELMGTQGRSEVVHGVN